MYTVVGKSDSNCRIGSIAVDDKLSTYPYDVPTLIGDALVSGGTCGADGVMYRWVSPESMMTVSCCGRIHGEYWLGI